MEELHKWLVTVLLVSLTQAVPFPASINPSATSRVRRDNQPINYRLPDNIVPNFYKINLDVDFDGEDVKFVGVSYININVKETTNVITMHAKNINVSCPVDVSCDDGNSISVSTIDTTDDGTDFVKIILERELQADSNCNLIMEYSGKGGEDYAGLYRTSYHTKNGQEKWIASSRFHYIGARQVFPCWDEPALKANFIISVKHKKNYTALSNMDSEESEIDSNDSDQTITHFAQSPKMSTYMVGITIGDFAMISNHDQEFRVWIPKNAVKNTNANFASQVGEKFLKAFGDYVDIPYKAHGLHKMDAVLAPLPPNFISMDSWGLITYDMDSLLLDDDWSSTAKKDAVAKTIARELANQWFGSLVTPSWYDSVWLSEGLSSYFLYAMIDQMDPTWRMMDKFVWENTLTGAFTWDGNLDSHAIVHEWSSSDDFNNPINTLTYAKSGSIIRMISYILGEEKIKTALQNYLKTKAFGSVTTDDLFQELAKVNTEKNINFLEILKSWVTVPGYPLVTVLRDYRTGRAIITQSRYLDKDINTTCEQYWIPINFITEDNLNYTNTNITQWFDPAQIILELDELKNDQFIILNKELFGYYRVNYDERNWQLITKFLETGEHTNIHLLNRAQLIDDALTLGKNGHIKYPVVLSLMGYLKKETDFIPWSVAWGGFEYMHNMVANTEFDKAYRDYIAELSEKLVNEVLSVGLDEADHTMKLKRVDALQWSCYYGSQLCRSRATEKLIEWLDDPEKNALIPDEKEWIVCAGVRNADEKTWNRLWKKYLNEKNNEILFALACTPNVSILKKFLFKFIAGDFKYQDFDMAFWSILDKSENGPTVALNFIIENYEKILALDGYTSDNLQSTLDTMGYKMRDRAKRDKVAQFIETNKVSLNGTADAVLVNVDRILKKLDSEQTKGFRNFLKNRVTYE